MRVPSVLALVAVAWMGACNRSHVPIDAAGAKERASTPSLQLSAQPTRHAPSPTADTAMPTPANAAAHASPPEGGASDACADSGVRRAIAEELIVDEEFRGYICEEEPCTAQEFLENLRFRDVVVLRDAPRTLGCIVGPLHEAMTRIYGVFVLNGQAPNLVLTYQGIDISVDPAFTRPGFKDLFGTERLGPGTWVTHRYVWHPRGYVLERTTEAVVP
jgi:hypothetical protein